MTHPERKFLGIAAGLFLLVGLVGCPPPAPAPAPPPPPPPPVVAGNPIAIYLTVDATNHVTVDPPSAHLYYGKANPDFADWQIQKGASPFVFTIKFNKYTSGPPPEHLPDPNCQGQNMGYHCMSVVTEAKYKGKHPYSIVVNGVVTDPDVTIDP